MNRLLLLSATIAACSAFAAEGATCDRPGRDSEVRYGSDPSVAIARSCRPRAPARVRAGPSIT